MASRSVSLKDFGSYLKKLKKNLSGADGAIVRGIHSGVMRSISIVHQSVTNAMPASPNGSVGAVNTGGYKGSWQFELTKTGGRIFSTHPAAPTIEEGRRPGAKMPPQNEIKLWAIRRLGLSEQEAERAKWAIAAAIAKRGLVGRKVLTNPLTTAQITKAVMTEVKAEIKKAMAGAHK